LVGTALRTHVGSLLQKEENDLHTYPTIIQDIQKQRDINLYKLVLDRCSNFHSTLSRVEKSSEECRLKPQRTVKGYKGRDLSL
jgi:hypothetical protein